MPKGVESNREQTQVKEERFSVIGFMYYWFLLSVILFFLIFIIANVVKIILPISIGPVIWASDFLHAVIIAAILSFVEHVVELYIWARNKKRSS